VACRCRLLGLDRVHGKAGRPLLDDAGYDADGHVILLQDELRSKGHCSTDRNIKAERSLGVFLAVELS
jgi:hypothetical protein